jgi:hypothetical protein
MIQMTTLTEVLDHLQREGYTTDFNLKDNCLECHGNLLQIFPHEFLVDKTYRFEGMTDPGDEAIIYAISSEKHSIKGTLVNGYGTSSSALTHEMVQALQQKHH